MSESKMIKLKEIKEFPSWLKFDVLCEFLHEYLKPYEDPMYAVKDGVNHALNEENNGFVLVSHNKEKIEGVLVMLDTGMKDYIPENLLLFIAVNSNLRGRGIGGKLINESSKYTRGSVKLHVDFDNPAKKLYERCGFVAKYYDMRKIEE